MEKKSLHIVVFPWFAFGHMLPFLELSKSLAVRGHRVTYISTPRNIQRLPKIPSHLSSLIQYVSFCLPHGNLPENAESTTDLPTEKVQFLKKALDGLEMPFDNFLESACSDSEKPDWIIMDLLHHWIPKVSQKYSIPCVSFSVLCASSMSFFGPPSEFANPSRTPDDFAVTPSWIPFPSNLAFSPHEIRSFVRSQEDNVSGISAMQRICSTILGSEFVCIRSCFPLEAKWLTLLADLYHKPVLPVGLLLPQIDKTLTRKSISCEIDVIDWLDQHDPKSILYIALGSEATLPCEQLHELALGLEMSKVPFLWALRTQISIAGENSSILPEGFLDRIKGFGLVVTSWISQITVLAHESVGGFLTHCGWSSVIEALQFGHPLVMLPLIIDQGLNSRVLEDKKLGITIPRNEDDGKFEKNDVAKMIRLIMVEEEGKIIRRNGEMEKEVFADRESHEKHFDDFVEHLQNFKQEV
ncbi:hypothetical protein LUZ60_006959 [Juncus effusus]|nr:hypothetical protein LUZ60_006959 [Juncus effusus]